jgi:hypothetical protein
MNIEKLNGYWDNEFYMVKTPDGYARCAAIKKGDVEELTPFGQSLLAYKSADVVVSEEPKKRGRKAKVDEVPEMDDLDI